MTFTQIKALCGEPEEIERWWRYERMTPQARETAKQMYQIYGEF